jgi:prepilin-type processing-associated H-X9-DG protein
MLMTDAFLWLLVINPTNPSGTIVPQAAARVVPSGAGANTIDRYRHGKYPQVRGTGTAALYSGPGGKQAFNILYADGHVATVSHIKDGYKAIRMRYP